jgi:hypothetical protein
MSKLVATFAVAWVLRGQCGGHPTAIISVFWTESCSVSTLKLLHPSIFKARMGRRGTHVGYWWDSALNLRVPSNAGKLSSGLLSSAQLHLVS